MNTELLYSCIFAFIAFCFLSSSIYCFNDICDAEVDKLHPTKNRRPIATGEIRKHVAYVIMICLMGLTGLTLFIGNICEANVAGAFSLYFIINIMYCIKLKHIALIDVFIIASGFVIRVICGGMVASILLSHWIIIMTFLLALFIALSKRRDDVIIFESTGKKPRKNINDYNTDYMNLAITIIATITIVAYIMYTVSPEVINRIGSQYVYISSIFVLLGIMRFLQLTIVHTRSGSPTKVLFTDRFIQLCISGWCITFAIMLYV